MKNYLNDETIPNILRDFLRYTQVIQGKSPKTTEEYLFDLRLYFRFLICYKENISKCDIDKIDITKVDIEFIKEITIEDTFEFLAYLANERKIHHKSEHSKLGISARSRARKISSMRSFFKYLVDKKKILAVNPIANLDFPKTEGKIAKYLSLDECTELLESIHGPFKTRDYAIILLFLSCGLRVSELVAINLNNFNEEFLIVTGKGNKERVVYLNENCITAITEYIKVRKKPNIADKNALFISRQGNRINVQTVKWLVKKYVVSAGINRDGISAHKLRHTAATLMYSNGLDLRTLQEVLGHKNLETTRIYTHINDDNLRKASELNPISKLKK